MKKSSTIIGLLFCRGPAAVSRFIVAMIVYAVNGISRSWSFAHVGIKVSEIIPSLANGYSSATPTVPLLTSWYQATFAHVKPTTIFGPFLGVPCAAMLPVRSTIVELIKASLGFFNSKAAATFCYFVTQRLAIDNACIPAPAKAIPSGITVRRICACS